MTTETAPVAEVAPQAQEPSQPATEVNKEAEAPQEQSTVEHDPAEAKRLIEAQNKKIARQQAANREQFRQFEEAKRKIAEYEAKLAASSKSPDDKPNPDNFDDTEAYAEALADWKLAQKDKAKAEETKQPDPKTLIEQQVQWELKAKDFKTKEAAFMASHPEYVENAKTVEHFLGLAKKNDPRFEKFSTVLMNAESPAALINYLGENPKEILNLFNAETPLDVQDSLEAIIEKIGAPTNIGDEEGSLSPAPKALPEPPRGLKSGTTKVNKTPDQMSGRELLNKYAK